MPEKNERGPFSLPRYCMLRGKKRKQENHFFGLVPWANRYNLKFCRTILDTSGIMYRKKH